jgi:hypothetical protein
MPTHYPRRARRLKNLKIDEVSSVDRGAGEGCTVQLHKRHDDHAAEIEKAFRALHESCDSIINDPNLDDDDRRAALDETMGQAHQFFGENFNMVGKSDDDVIEIEKGHTPMSAYEELMLKATELCKESPKLSRSQAFAKCYSDPANRELANADRAQRRAQHVSKDAADRLVDRMAALRASNPNISVDDSIDRVRKRNPELIEAWQKGRTNVDPVGSELPGQDDVDVDNNWAPQGRNRSGDNTVYDGSSTTGSPRSYGTPRYAVAPSGPGYGDTDDALLALWRAWQKQIPSLTPDDIANMVAWRTPDSANVGKSEHRARSRTPVGDRVHARAAAMAQQHNVDHSTAVQSILSRDKTLARAYQNEIERS